MRRCGKRVNGLMCYEIYGLLAWLSEHVQNEIVLLLITGFRVRNILNLPGFYYDHTAKN